jgi:hypothetical protein
VKLVKTDDARPGQKAARDVTDLRGNLLFRAGTELNAELLASCKQRNVSHLFVEDVGGAAAASPVDVETRRVQLGRDIDRQFAGVDQAAVMASLREAAKRHLLAKLGG